MIGVAIASRSEVFNLEPLEESSGAVSLLRDEFPNYKVFLGAFNPEDVNHCSGSSLL